MGTFLVFGTLGVFRHEMWRDEVQVWNLARSSSSIADLFANMRTEGHPALWHLCVYAISQLSHSPLSMQLFHLGIAAFNVYLLVKFSPFTQMQKVMMTFGYFNFFEYALIARSYAMGITFTFLFCSTYRWCQRQQQSSNRAMAQIGLLLPFVILAFLANTSLYGLFLSVALCIPLLWLGSASSLTTDLRRPKALFLKAFGVGILCLGWLSCYLQISRINVAHSVNSGLVSNIVQNASTLGTLRAIGRRLFSTVSQVWRSYVPVPTFWREDFWIGNALADVDGWPQLLGMEINVLVATALSLLLVVWAVRCFYPKPKYLAVYVTGTLLPMAFSYFLFRGSIRHYGHLFIVLLACFWLVKVDVSYKETIWCRWLTPPIAAFSEALVYWAVGLSSAKGV